MRQGHDDPFWPVHREKFDERNLFYLWDLISLGYTFLFLAIANLSVRLQLRSNGLDVVKQLSDDPAFVGKMAQIVQYLETTSVDSDKKKLYQTCLDMHTQMKNDSNVDNE